MWLPHTTTILQIGQSSTWCRGHRPHRGVCRETTHPAHLSRMAASVRDVETLQGHRASPTLCPCRVVSAWSRLCRVSGALSTPTFMNLVRGLWDIYLWRSEALGVHLQTLNYILGGCWCQRNELQMLLKLHISSEKKIPFLILYNWNDIRLVFSLSTGLFFKKKIVYRNASWYFKNLPPFLNLIFEYKNFLKTSFYNAWLRQIQYLPWKEK